MLARIAASRLTMIGRARGRPQRLWIASELMYPELTSTGFYITAIAERMARTRAVEVLCAQPTYAARGTRAPARERWRNITIRRSRGITFNKDTILGRLANMVTFSASAFAILLRRLRAGDVVLVVTNPPTLPVVVALACRFRRSRYVLLLHDLYPDLLVAAAGVRERAMVVRVWRWVNRRLFPRADRIIVVGRDVKQRLERCHPEVGDKVTVIANWGEVDAVRPAERAGNRLLAAHRLADRFVVLYAGNLGWPNDLATIVESADRLRNDSRFHFLFVGTGAKEPWLKQTVDDRKLSNVSRLGQRLRSEQPEFLNACDLAVVPVVRGMWGVAVPSRMYNFLAAGKPILAIAEPGSEIDLLVRETGTGWVTPPHDVDGFVAALVDAASEPQRLSAMGARARRAAEEHYSGQPALDQYEAEIHATFEADRPR